MLLPCLAIFGGNCQEAVILVEELAVTVKSLGACEGTEIKKKNKQTNKVKQNEIMPRAHWCHM